MVVIRKNQKNINSQYLTQIYAAMQYIDNSNRLGKFNQLCMRTVVNELKNPVGRITEISSSTRYFQ